MKPLVPLFFSVVLCTATVDAESLRAVAGSQKPTAYTEPYTEKKISLSGSRGEVLNFLLKANLDTCSAITLELGDSKLKKSNFTFYELLQISTSHASFPGAYIGKHYDPLLELDSDGHLCPVDSIDNGNVKAQAGETIKWIWAELLIPYELAPGESTIEVALGEHAKVEIQLEVWTMRMPREPKLPAYMELTPWYALLGHYAKWVPKQEALLAKSYAAELRAHRIYPLKSHIRKPVVIEVDSHLSLNLEDYPSVNEAFIPVTLSERPDFAYFDFPALQPGVAIDESTSRYFDAMSTSLEKLGPRASKAIMYVWDEPEDEQFPQLLKLLRLLKERAKGVKRLVTTGYQPILHGLVDIFVPVINDFGLIGKTSPAKYRELQQEGKEVWWYVSCMSHGCDALLDTGHPDFVIERPSVYIRSIAWLSHKYQIDAFLYYQTLYSYQFYPKRDTWNSIWDFSGNGDGTLFYPGRKGEHGLNRHTPIPSLRLKVWREASFDAEYLSWISQVKVPPAWFEAEMSALLISPSKWNKNYHAYQRLRNRIGRYLHTQSVVSVTERLSRIERRILHSSIDSLS